MSACEKGKQWEAAVGLLQEMVQQSLILNVMSWSAAISVCEKGKQLGKALDYCGRWCTSC